MRTLFDDEKQPFQLDPRRKPLCSDSHACSEPHHSATHATPHPHRNRQRVQIYICQQAAAGPQWTFQAPEAALIDASGKPVGTHGTGPIWKSTDGSTVKGQLLQKSASPEATSIPWLLLKAVGPSGSGIMTRVEYIRRSDTHGGASPASGCDAQHLSVVSRVPYTATYTFYSATP